MTGDRDIDPDPQIAGRSSDHAHTVTLESVGPPTVTVIRDALACVALALLIVVMTGVITWTVLLGLAGRIDIP